MSDEAKIAYAAGFFDGEGHVRIQRHSSRGSYMLSVSVVQATPFPLELFVELFGGGVKRRVMQYRGRPKCLFTWQASSKAAECALLNMQPYIRAKSDEVALALEFRSTFRPQYGNRSKNSPELESSREQAMRVLQQIRKDKRQQFVDDAQLGLLK
jgi:hypothetical protein